MSSSSDFPARGKIIRVDQDAVIFAPSKTTYELKLAAPGGYSGPVNSLVDIFIRGTGRKLWTVSSGGNFITPIQGPPRIVQGRVKYMDEKIMVVQAGAPVIVELPHAESAFDLNCGPLGVGALVNATLMPGVKLELAAAPVA